MAAARMQFLFAEPIFRINLIKETIRRMAELYKAFEEERGLKTFQIVGHYFGGVTIKQDILPTLLKIHQNETFIEALAMLDSKDGKLSNDRKTSLQRQKLELDAKLAKREKDKAAAEKHSLPSTTPQAAVSTSSSNAVPSEKSGESDCDYLLQLDKLAVEEKLQDPKSEHLKGFIHLCYLALDSKNDDALKTEVDRLEKSKKHMGLVNYEYGRQLYQEIERYKLFQVEQAKKAPEPARQATLLPVPPLPATSLLPVSLMLSPSPTLESSQSQDMVPPRLPAQTDNRAEVPPTQVELTRALARIKHLEQQVQARDAAAVAREEKFNSERRGFTENKLALERKVTALQGVKESLDKKSELASNLHRTIAEREVKIGELEKQIQQLKQDIASKAEQVRRLLLDNKRLEQLNESKNLLSGTPPIPYTGPGIYQSARIPAKANGNAPALPRAKTN